MPKPQEITLDIRQKIVAQAIKEISHARIYKQGKVGNWQKNENMYYGVKEPNTESRANVNLARMQGFVHKIQAKISRQQIFKFSKRKEAQLQRVRRLNALRDIDKSNDFWQMKMLVGAKQLVIYGREIYNYYADSVEGYKPHLGNSDVYDFLIDPEGGGIDVEQAMYLGDFGVVLTRQALEAGKGDIYLEDATTTLLQGTGNNTEQTKEEINKRNRSLGQNTSGPKELQNTDKFKFWRWCTTFEGERYYLLLQESAALAIRVERLVDMFSPTKLYVQGAWPYWTNAAFPDLTEFWTPSYCDAVREIFMAQDVSVDQALDNAEGINKPQKVVNVSAIEDLSKLKYRRDGIIPTKGNFDASKAIQVLSPASIDTPIKVFEMLEKIQEKDSGVSPEATGGAANGADQKATIYTGNKIEADERFGLLDLSRSFGITRFGRLYEIGVRDNLTKKVAVDMIGPDGIETEEIKRSDIFRKGDDFSVAIEDSQADAADSVQKNVVKINFLNAELTAQNASPYAPKIINPKKAFELKAKAAGVPEEEIKELMDISEFGNADLLAEAARDLESLLDGDDVKPNAAANNAYKQKIVTWMTDHEEDMTDDQFKKVSAYIRLLDPIIAKNEARAVNAFAIKQINQGASMLPTDAPANGAGAPANNPVKDLNAVPIPSIQA